MDIRLFGATAVLVDGVPVKLGGPLQRAVFALLALHHGKLVPTETIIDRVWGDDAVLRSRNTVQVYVSTLRHQFRTAGAPITIEAVSTSGYRLTCAPELLDVERFDRELERARTAHAMNDLATALDALDAAFAISRGPLLDDLNRFECFQPDVSRTSEHVLEAAELRLRCLSDLGRDSEVIADAERLLQQHPLRESAWHSLALGHYRASRQADALRTIERARQTLAEEVGLDLGPDMRELEQRILVHDRRLLVGQRFPRVRWLDPADGTAHVLELVDGRTFASIGRAPHNDIVLGGDLRASRSHCELQLEGDAWRLVPDPFASNGTFVNSIRVRAAQRLGHGDRIRAGETVLLFEERAPALTDDGPDQPTEITPS